MSMRAAKAAAEKAAQEAADKTAVERAAAAQKSSKKKIRKRRIGKSKFTKKNTKKNKVSSQYAKPSTPRSPQSHSKPKAKCSGGNGCRKAPRFANTRKLRNAKSPL